MFDKKYICGSCGEKITPTKEKKGSVLIFIILLFLAIIPGIIYAIWASIGLKDICPKCKSLEVIPCNTPRGKKLLAEYGHAK